LGDAAGALDDVAFADVVALAHDGDTDVVLLEVEDEAHQPVRELDQLAGHYTGHPVHARDAVSRGEHGPGLAHLDLLAVSLDLLAKDAADLVGSNLHLVCSVGAAMPARAEFRKAAASAPVGAA